MDKNFSVDICSDLDLEELYADILYQNKCVAMITQEKGIDNMEIKIYSSEEESWNFSLDEFMNIIRFAKKRLIKMQKIPD